MDSELESILADHAEMNELCTSTDIAGIAVARGSVMELVTVRITAGRSDELTMPDFVHTVAEWRVFRCRRDQAFFAAAARSLCDTGQLHIEGTSPYECSQRLGKFYRNVFVEYPASVFSTGRALITWAGATCGDRTFRDYSEHQRFMRAVSISDEYHNVQSIVDRLLLRQVMSGDESRGIRFEIEPAIYVRHTEWRSHDALLHLEIPKDVGLSTARVKWRAGGSSGVAPIARNDITCAASIPTAEGPFDATVVFGTHSLWELYREERPQSFDIAALSIPGARMNLEEAPYPWHLPVARDLHKRLVDVFSDPSDAQALVRGAKEPNPTKIDWKQDIDAVWRQTLARASAEGALRNLLAFIVAESAMPPSTMEFVQTLLSNVEPPAASAPTRQQGEPVFAGATKAEALLFGDDLTESVGEIPGLLESIERVMASQRAVCKLHVYATDGYTYFGTGTLLVGNRILTNHHVLFPDGKAGTRVIAEFDFELDANGQAIKSANVACEVTTITADEADDWGTIALAEAPPATATPLDLAAKQAVAKAGERAFIIQHPSGRPKRLGFVRNRVSSVEARRLFYLTDTESGSSGSLVFNGEGNVIGLHRRGGIPQKFIGMAPLKKNEGVRIDVIIATVGLLTRGEA